jgi:2OG-Fe(II) oxygenase superfamily
MTLELLDIQAIRDATLREKPFTWAALQHSFMSTDVAQELADCFPQDGFGEKHRRLGESSVSGGHYLNGRGLVTRETGEIHRAETLDPIWVQLAHELLSVEYRSAMAALTGCDLTGTLLEAIVFRQPAGGYLDPHPDNPGKPASQVFYFNSEPWEQAEGGWLRILGSNDIDDVHEELAPVIDRSVVLVRSDDSWHGYLPVQGDRQRLSLQIFFCQPSMRFATEYGPDWTRAPRITRPLRLDRAGRPG